MKHRRIPYRNRSPHGWWLATYIIRTEWNASRSSSPSKRCLAWENTVILKAPTRTAAFARAISLGKKQESTFEDAKNNRKGRWIFEGLSSLVPIYEKLDDGAELFWVEHRNKTIGKVRSFVKRKDQLEAFDDRPAIGDSNT